MESRRTLPAEAVDGWRRALARQRRHHDQPAAEPQPFQHHRQRHFKGIGGAANNNAATQAVGQALANIERGLETHHNMRGYAGDLNRADRITGDQEQRSSSWRRTVAQAKDQDMIKGIRNSRPGGGLPRTALRLSNRRRNSLLRSGEHVPPAQRARPQMPAAPPEGAVVGRSVLGGLILGYRPL